MLNIYAKDTQRMHMFMKPYIIWDARAKREWSRLVTQNLVQIAPDDFHSFWTSCKQKTYVCDISAHGMNAYVESEKDLQRLHTLYRQIWKEKEKNVKRV